VIAARVALALVALAVGGWLAFQERAARAEERLTQLAFATRGPLAPAAARRGEDLLRADRLLNPDRRPDQIESVLLVREGRTRAAVALLLRTARARPEDVQTWALLAVAASRVDPRLAARARARVRALAPPVPPPR
jgi:hypothetical protein